MQLHRSIHDKMIGGICSGIGETIGVAPLYIRLLFLVLSVYAGSTFWLYLLLWVILPVLDAPAVDYKRFYRNPHDKMIAGVCSGLAPIFSTDATVIRLVFIGFGILGGASVWIYLVLWLFSPLDPS
ncbi:MAG: hypothetical protein CVU48_03490 [Candidatus Cloacimonetes bacterium HGW-Cloacimonetes-1]|jgi:phage shock protein PspC (stress-responsive transcriptional regulator)|nr:MAG: hypothetical protein CVU48_03490 [Candidatus Cloacimonetes bacterium HGW-Cloacimonetes-1]